MLENGTIRLRAVDDDQILRLFDPQWRVVSEGVGRIEFSGVPGLYHVELSAYSEKKTFSIILIPGKVSEHAVGWTEGGLGAVGLKQSTMRKHLLERNLERSSVLQNAYEIPMAAGQGGLVIVVPSEIVSLSPFVGSLETASNLVLRMRDGAPPMKPKEFAMLGRNHTILRYQVLPGVWQVEVKSVDLPQRVTGLAVYVEADWVTEMYLAQPAQPKFDGPTVVAMFRQATPSSADKILKTETALVHLSLGYAAPFRVQESLDWSEPVRVIARAYARLQRHIVSIDRALTVISPAITGNAAQENGTMPSQGHIDKLDIEELKCLANLGKEGLAILPNSPDLRLIALAALWEDAAHKMTAPSVPLTQLQSLAAFVKVSWRRDLLTVFAALGTLALLANQTANLQPSQGVSPWFPWLAAAIGALIGMVWLYQRVRIRRLVFLDPPVFAEGIRILLRLAALYEQMSEKSGGRLADIALRRTADALWTKWDASETAEEARMRFDESMSELHDMLEIHGGCAHEADSKNLARGSLTRRAAVHIAVSLSLPLAIVLPQMKRFRDNHLRRVSCIAGASLAIVLRQKIWSPNNGPSKNKLSRYRREKNKPLAAAAFAGLASAAMLLFVLVIRFADLNIFRTEGAGNYGIGTSARAGTRKAPTAEGNTADGDTIKIAVVTSISGENKPWGTDQLEGCKLAVDEVNQAGGINGKKIEIVEGDTASRADQAKLAAEKVLSTNVIGIVGEVSSENTIQIAKSAFDKGVPVVAVGATRTTVTEEGAHVFRVCFTDAFQGPAMAQFAFEKLNKKKVAILTDNASPYSQGLSESFRAEFTKLGGEIVADERYESGSKQGTDYSGVLTNIAKKAPEAMFMSGYFTEVGPISKQARAAGITAVFLGGDGWDSDTLLTGGDDSIIGGFFANHYNNFDPSPAVQGFLTRWKAAHGGAEPSTTMGALGYDAMAITIDALKRAKSMDSKSLMAALEDTVDFKGVSGTITLKGKNGNPPKKLIVVEITKRNGSNWQKFATSYTPDQIK